MAARTALLLFVSTLFACMTRPAPVAATAPEGDGEAQAPIQDAPAPSAPPDGAAPIMATDAAAPASTSSEPARQCRMTVTDTENCTTAEIEALIAPARQSLQECAGDKGGKVVVGLRSVNGKLSFDLEPDASLDPTERRCILDALARIPSDAQRTMTGQPRADGFTSHVTIEW